MLHLPTHMSIFSRPSSGNSEQPGDDFATPPALSPPAAQFTMPDIDDAAAMRKYVAERFIVESQLADSPSARIAALKALSDIVLVTEDTRFRAATRVKQDVTANIVIVQEALRDAKSRAIAEH